MEVLRKEGKKMILGRWLIFELNMHHKKYGRYSIKIRTPQPKYFSYTWSNNNTYFLDGNEGYHTTSEKQ